MNACIVIPTYWSTQEIDSWKTFDHPTSINEEGTLGRTLDNFEKMNISVPVILFPAPTHRTIEEKVKKIVGKRTIDVHVFSEKDLIEIKNTLTENGFPKKFIKDINMDSYGAIRNMGLIYANMKGYDNVIQIDDDELIEDNEYIDKALEMINDEWSGERILAKTGFYYDENDKVYYDGQLKFEYKNWPKDELFNAELKRCLESDTRLISTISASGGNMIINRDMYLKVPYDPYGTRGEDDDYAINALYNGMKFYFDTKLWVRHLPPKRKKAYWTRHRQDIIRFKYLREKIRRLHLSPDDMGVFISRFVKDDLDYMAVSSSIHAAKNFLEDDREEFNEFLNNAILAVKIKNSDMIEKSDKFLSFMEAWQKVMPKITRAMK